MSTSDFAAMIDGLLRRPLQSLHLNQLSALKEKERYGDLTEVDKIYITDIWGKFRSLPVAPAERKPQKSADDTAPPASDLEAELKRMNVTIDKLREALREISSQRDHWKTQAEHLAKKNSAQARQVIAIDEKFDRAKRAFAKFYHPNALAGRSQLDVMIRSEIFKEFWTELERIEAAD